MATSKGMVNVAGVTYRLVEQDELHLVFRLLDDRLIGIFRDQPRLMILETSIGTEALVNVAHAALKAGKLH